MKKTEVYSWRVAVELKRSLEEAARAEKLSLAQLLERIGLAWLARRAEPDETEADIQQQLHQLAAQSFGSVQSGNPSLSREVSQRMKSKMSRRYRLKPLAEWTQNFEITPTLAEDFVWRSEIAPRLGTLPDNVMNIWNYGFTEMFNNAIDHSEGHTIIVYLVRSETETEIYLLDDGVGIFKKIQKELGLLDERHSVLELAKGKLTTTPDRHSGEGIFFTSRMFDEFTIISGDTYFSHKFSQQEDWIQESQQFSSGTSVRMKLSNHTSRTDKKIFDHFSSGDDYGFNKTVVPVKLAQYGSDRLISRSQAKRLIVRFDRFKTVVLDFEGVDGIGQAFADEVFRVFQNQHPDIELVPINANEDVMRMIKRAMSNR
ncbi:MAG: DUF4325 domain-containing protein [Cyanobacteria bacterium J06634_6]